MLKDGGYKTRGQPTALLEYSESGKWLGLLVCLGFFFHFMSKEVLTLTYKYSSFSIRAHCLFSIQWISLEDLTVFLSSSLIRYMDKNLSESSLLCSLSISLAC